VPAEQGQSSRKDLDGRIDALRKGPNGVDPWSLAHDLVDAGRAAEAEEIARLGLAKEPKSIPGRAALGRAIFARGDAKQAQAILVGALKDDREAPRVLAVLAEVLRAGGETEKSGALLKKALRLGKDDEIVRGVEARMSGRAEEAQPPAAEPPSPAAPSPAPLAAPPPLRRSKPPPAPIFSTEPTVETDRVDRVDREEEPDDTRPFRIETKEEIALATALAAPDPAAPAAAPPEFPVPPELSAVAPVAIALAAAPRPRRTGRILLFGLAALLGAGATYGGVRFSRARRAEALVVQARELAARGTTNADAAALRSAERKLVRAISKGASEAGGTLAWVQAVRWLQIGEGDLASVEAAVAAAAPGPDLDLARAALAIAKGRDPNPTLRGSDPRARWLAALAAERKEDPATTELFRRAAEGADALVAAKVGLVLRLAEVEDAAGARAAADGLADSGLAAAVRAVVLDGTPPPQAELGPNGRLLRAVSTGEAVDVAACTDPMALRLAAARVLAAGHPAAAERAAGRAFELAPRQPRGLLLLAKVHLERRDPTRALAALEGLDASDRSASLLRARALIDSARAADAIPVARAILQSSPADLEAKLLELRARARSGDALEAQRLTGQIETEHPADRRVLHAMADVLLHADEPEASLRRSDALIAADRSDDDAHFLRGHALRAAGNLDGALAAYADAHRTNPDLVEALLAGGEIEDRRGRHAEARALCERAIEVGRKREESSLCAATAALGDGDPDAAARFADGAGDSAQVRLFRARIAVVRGDGAAALSLLDPLVAAGRSATVLSVRAQARTLAGDRAGAREDLRGALEVDEDHLEATIGMGELLVAEGDHPGARRWADKAFAALAGAPAATRARSLVLLGRIALAKGRAGRPFALRCAQDAIAVDPGYPDARRLAQELGITGR